MRDIEIIINRLLKQVYELCEQDNAGLSGILELDANQRTKCFDSEFMGRWEDYWQDPTILDNDLDEKFDLQRMTIKRLKHMVSRLHERKAAVDLALMQTRPLAIHRE